jgi:trigger factor
VKFENEKIEVEVEDKGGCQVELDVSMKPEACQGVRAQALKAIRQHVSVPGFRKGKAPTAMLEKNYAKAIEEEFQERIQRDALNEALKLTKIYPWQNDGVGKPEVESASVEGAQIKFRFEREPDIPELKPEELQLKKEAEQEISEEAIEKEIASLRRQRATHEEDEAGKATEMSWCRIDLENLKEDPPLKILTNHRVQLDPDKVASWLIDLTAGKSAGESTEGMTTPSKDLSEKELEEFEPSKVRVTVVAVEKEVLPSDEALCEAMKVDSIGTLKTQVADRLKENEKRRIEMELKKSLWQELLTKYPFEMPRSLVESELRSTIQRLVEEMRSLGKGDQEIEEQEKAIEERAAAEVAHRLHTLFMARKVTADSGKQPTDDEVNQRTHELLLWESLSQGRMLNPKDQDPRVINAYRQRAFLMLMQERAEEVLLDAANIA